MNLVIEGPKASGKSTISHYFIEKYLTTYDHMSSDSDNSLEGHLNLLKGKKGESLNHVIDRFSVGEMIYPNLYGREGKLNLDEFNVTMSSENTLYVILYSSSDQLLFDRIEWRGRNTDDEAHDLVSKSNFAFKMIGESLKYRENVLLFDVAKVGLKEIIKIIEDKLEELNRC